MVLEGEELESLVRRLMELTGEDEETVILNAVREALELHKHEGQRPSQDE